MSQNLTFEIRDEFRRKPAAEKIITLLKSDVKITPMLIQGGWGSGKTEFTHKLINEIRNHEQDNFQTVYFNAFAADRVDNPLLSLIAQMQHVLQTTDASRSLKETAAPLIKLAYVATYLLGRDPGQMAESVQRAGNTAIENMIDDHAAAEVTLQAFKVRLAEYSQEMPLIIFIDELDRCRPDYALNLIETIKHVFDVKNVQFVVVANVEQLTSSISHCYGIEKPREYLDKFFNFTFVLSDSILDQAEAYIPNAEKHFNEEYRKNAGLLNLGNETLEMIRWLIKRNRLSLRQVETFIRYLTIYRTLGHTIATGNPRHSCQRILGIYIYLFHPFLAQSILNETYSPTEIIHLFTDLEAEEIIPCMATPQNTPNGIPVAILKLLLHIRLASPEKLDNHKFREICGIINPQNPLQERRVYQDRIAPTIRQIMLSL